MSYKIENELIDNKDNIKINKIVLKKMLFITNALEQGWSVRKKHKSYIFEKKHDNRKEIFNDKFLDTFILSNTTVDIM